MRTLSQEEDPNEERVQTDGTVSMPKRGLIDRIPTVLTIDVTTASNVATVNVLPACAGAWRASAHSRANLSV